MRKIVLFIFVLTVVLSLCACQKEHVHSFGEWETISEPTCTKTGLRERYCPCGEIETRELPANDHSFSEWIVDSERSCTSDGVRRIECTVCGETVKTETVLRGHNLGEWIIDSEATCTEDGLRHNSCLDCKDTVEEVLSSPGHDIVVVEKGIAATCTEDGKSDKKSCSVCGEIISESENIKALGHNWVNEKCTVCKCDRYYVIGETWVTPEWEFTITSVEVHYACNPYSNELPAYQGEQVIVINYKYKNTGYVDEIQDLFISQNSFSIYDSESEIAASYPCTHYTKYPKPTDVGGACSAQEVFVLFNKSDKIILKFEQYFSNFNQKGTATFILPIG